MLKNPSEKGSQFSMSLTEEMKKYGANITEAMERFMGNEAIYEKMLKKFPAAVESHQVAEYIKKGDNKTAVANAHTLKGVTGNLSITPLYNAYVEIVNLLRAEENDKALAATENILQLQQSIVECISDNV